MIPVSISRQLLSVLLIANLLVTPIADPLPVAPSNSILRGSMLLPRTNAAAAPAAMHTALPNALPAAAMLQSSTLGVSVAFADNSSSSLNFPTPWQGAPNVVFLGSGSPQDSGAIRIDNPGSAPLTIDSVSVDLQRGNAQFNLWGSFTVPGQGSAILTQTQPGNFDTSAFPIVACGGTLAAAETRIPKITVTVAGTPQTFMDTAHVLDTGGFDLSCRGNESLQWRPVGTTGIESASGHLTLSPSSSSGSGGSPLTTTAQLTDAAGSPLAAVTVNFKILSGPNAGQSAQGVTDSQGNANFTYTSSLQGADVIQASISNASGSTVQSGQATVNWQTASCGAPSTQSGTPNLIYIGSTTGEYNDNGELAALLTDGTGAAAAGRSLTFTYAGQTFSGTTDATGVARVAVTLSSAPGPAQVSINFAGDATLPQLSATATINVDRDETFIRYTGKTLLGNSSPQPVTALLLDPQTLAPVPNEPVTFRVGTVTASAVTDSTGLASTTISLGSAQVGPSSLTVSFAGDQFFKPSVRTVPVTLFFPAGFVLWGGNNSGLKIGQQVNFWGSQWENQVINGQYFAANPSFKGWSGSLAPVQQCQVNATPSTVTTACWQVKPGQSFPPSQTLPDFIEVVVSTVIVKNGDTVFGNIACGAVVKVNHTPPYGGVPGQPGFGTIVAVDGNCGNVFPAPAVVSATQTQPASVLPGQQITISTTVSNTSTATAATNVALNETLDGLTPATVSQNLNNVQPGGSQSTTFQAVVPNIPVRQGSESSADYIQRLSSLNGREFTVSGQVTFTDAQQQNYLPVDVSSRSILNIPVLTLALTGPAVVSPGSTATYLATATNIGSAPASSVQINATLPDGTTRLLTIASLQPGSSFSQPISFTEAAIAPIGASETTEQYLARLAAADGQLLTASASLNWSDALGNGYGDVGQQMFSSKVRVPVLNFSGTAPATLLPSQNATLNFNVNNSGGCTAVLSTLQVTNPDGSTSSAPQFPLNSGASTTAQTTWHVTAFPGRTGGETDAAYLTRLAATNNSALNFTGSLAWFDPQDTKYGPTTEPVQSKEVLPIVTVSLGAPATAQAGSSIAYSVTLTNAGGAIAPASSLTVTLPDGSVQSPAVGALAPGATFQTSINFAIPTTQAAGTISATASVLWNDAGGYGYGPLSSTAQTTVTNPTQFNSLVLAPAIAGPNVTGTTQTLTATLKDSTSTPIPNATVVFTVTGANPATASITTNASGIATLTYTGTHNGTDTVQATSGTAVSNTATVSWVTPVQNISTATVFARFFASDGSGGFNTPATATPAFTQSFPTINFNPPAGTIPGNTSGVGVNTRPFIDVTTDLNGNFTGTIIAQGNNLRAGEGSLFTFQAVFTSSFTVASAGDVVLSFFSDDGFILGIGGGATRVSGPLLNVPPGGVTAFSGFPVVGAFNSATAPVANTIVVHFPAAGSYPYELDYTECCGGQESLTMAVGQANSKGVPPTGSLTLSPNNPPTLNAGQTQTITAQAFDAGGAVVPNVGVALIINGANQQQLSATTDSTGRATFHYAATNAGTDSLQAVGNIGGLGAFSNIVNVTWTVPPGGGTGGGTTTFAQQGWIGAPLIGTTLQGRVPVTVAAGISLTSGTLEYWPTANPSDIHVLNANTTGSGTLGTFDGTTLANGSYIIQLQATASNGTQQTSVILVSVTGDNKPGRFTKTVTDMRIPVAGLKINVARTYDSLLRGRVGDFGFGWSLTVGVQLEVSPNNDVTFTFNGRRVSFKFATQAGPFPFPFLLLPKYFPQTGVVGTLTSDGCGVMVSSQGSLLCFPGVDTYNPTTFTYTDPYGRVYVFGRDGTMKSVQDLNGNTLTFGPNGITSAGTGVNIPFARDAQGRITSVTDTNGNSFNYSYDAAGNLVNVLIPNSPNPVVYGYTTDHFLNKEVDPRGGTSQSVYDANGRLQSVTDPLGNLTQFSYDLVANTITTTNPDGGITVRTNDAAGNMISYKDPLGRTTTYTYDNNQNVLTRTNGLGKTTTFTYDANGNVTSKKDPLGNKVTKTYDNIGRLTQMTDALGQVTQMQHDTHGNLTGISDAIGVLAGRTVDAKGNVTSQTAPNGATAQFTYDNFGNQISVTDHIGFTSSRTYDAMGNWTGLTDSRHGSMSFQFDNVGHMTLRQDPAGNQLKYSYDDVGNRSGETDPNGNSYSYGFDAANNQTRKTYPDGSTFLQTYDYAGRVLTATNQSNQVTKRVYDKAGQLTSVTFGNGTADAASISYSYDAAGRLSSLTDARGNHSSVTYDDADRITTLTDALGRTTNLVYDADGRVTQVTRPGGAKTQFAYDVRNRPITVTNPDGTKKQVSFDGLTLHSRTDEAGKTTTYTYNSLAELTSVTDALGHATQYGYDAVGNLASVTDAAGHVTGYQYDAADRRIKKTLPDGSFEQYTYDGNSNITAVRLTDGHVNQYTYDPLDRITQINYFDGQVVTFTYTPTGKRKTATTSAGTWQYAYDNTDRLAKITQPDLTAIIYTYDAMNNVASITTPGRVTRYTYDALNRLATVTDPLGGITTYTYDASGRLTQKALPNGILTKYTYDSLDRMTAVTHQLGAATPFESFQYTLSPSGKRLGVTEKDGTQTTWTYDDGYRLLSETVTLGAASSTTSYTYDAVGNRVTTTSGGTTTNYQYNQLDQLTSAGTAQYSYDGRGNLTQITDTPGTTSYTYDGANRMTSVALPGVGTAATYAYDGDGFLASRSQGGAVRRYAWDKISSYGDVLYETDGSGNVQANYTLAEGNLIQQITSSNPAASYFLHDGLGSVIGLTNPAGVQTDRYRFDAYGQPRLATGTSANAYRYRSQRTEDVSGLLYLRARYFSAATGRFTTRDRSEFRLSDPIDLNRYNYAASNPINGYDPTGNQDAAEYGMLAKQGEENATIEGYVVGRADETLLSCAGDVLLSVLDEAVGVLGGIWENLPNKITVAVGHAVENPLDIKYGPDQVLLAEMQNDAARKALLAKAAEFEASPRENILAISGRYVPREFRQQAGNWEIVFFADNGANATGPTADKCQNHAERKVLSISGAPFKSILESVGASRGVCLSCAAAMKAALVGCFAPLSTRVCVP